MSSAVVRCPECRGSSRVEVGSLGLVVQCPHCSLPFEAVEVIEMSIPARPPRNPTLAPPRPERGSRGERSDRPRRRKSRREKNPAPPQEPDHDPHRLPPGPLPVSVLIGLALLPFAIPVLWLVGPALFGEQPVLSIATPIALAVSASVLCLAVIYTIDWTPGTRVKGVLMLVCVTYFAAMNLYFLKKEMVDKLQHVTGLEEGIHWQEHRNGNYDIKMPGKPELVQGELLPKLNFKYYTSSYSSPILGRYTFTAGAAKLPQLRAGEQDKDPKPGSTEWYDTAEIEIKNLANGQISSKGEVKHYDFKGREILINFGDSGNARVVQLYVIRGYVYYLSVEGRNMNVDDEFAHEFFNSFKCKSAKD